MLKKTATALAKKDVVAAARYNLPRGMAMLGPAGFVFEQYVEAILRTQGYETIRNVMMKGVCVSHEIDILAEKENEHCLVEVKYHNKHHIKTHVDVAMYADARLNDIIPIRRRKEHKKFKHNMWLITNTKFTNSAIRYGKCKKLKMLGWNYPAKQGLEDIIVKNQLFPISALPVMNTAMLKLFVDQNIMLMRDLVKYTPEKLQKRFRLSLNTSKKILTQVHRCCTI